MQEGTIAQQSIAPRRGSVCEAAHYSAPRLSPGHAAGQATPPPPEPLTSSSFLQMTPKLPPAANWGKGLWERQAATSGDAIGKV